MAEKKTMNVPTWEYHDRNIQGNIEQSDFTRADRVVIYVAPTPVDGAEPLEMKPVGMIQSMSHSENKQLQQLFELGSSVPMIVPGHTNGSIQLQRVMISGKDLLNAIYNGPETDMTEDDIVRSIRDISRPFDMMMAKYPVLDDKVGTTALSTTLFRGCHIQSRNESISAGGVVVFEQMGLMYQYIPKVTFKNVTNSAASRGIVDYT